MASSVFIGLRFCSFVFLLIVYLKSIQSVTGRMMHNVKGKLAWCICVCFACVCVCVCTCYECLTGWRLWLLFFGTIWETNDISSPKASGRQIDTAACLKSGRHNYTGKKRRWCVCTTDECRSKWWMKDPITEINAMGKQYGEREKKRDVHTRQRAHIFTAKQNNYQWLLLVKEMMGMELNLTHFYVL